MKGVDNHNKENPPRGEEIPEEGQGKEVGSVSAEEVHRVAFQVDNGDGAFLLMAEVTVSTATASLSTVALGASLSLGVWTMMIILGFLLPQQWPRQQQWLRSWWGSEDKSNFAAPVVDGGNFWFGLSPL